MSSTVVVLAAGKGTRMNSSLEKVMHNIAEFPMISYVFNNIAKVSPNKVVLVTAPNMENIRAFGDMAFNKIVHCTQDAPLGTAHAVKSALPEIPKQGNTVIIFADTPFIKPDTINKLIHSDKDIVVVGFYAKDPKAYGRIITYNQDLIKIVEFSDALEEEKEINLCNSGIIKISNHLLHNLIHKINSNNIKKEFYLTDIIKLAIKNEASSEILICEEKEVFGINTKEDLSKAQTMMQQIIKQNLMDNGVTFIDPASCYLAYDCEIGKDSTIYPNNFIGKNVKIANNVMVYSFCYLEGCDIDDHVKIGPFARIRPNTEILSHARIGNFVEIKNSNIKSGAKISHLSYIGDAAVGYKTNIGAGTITCNFNGVNQKFRTYIGDEVSVGANCSLIAPLTVNSYSFIAAGSVITEDIAENDLAFGRAKQTVIKGRAKKIYGQSK